MEGVLVQVCNPALLEDDKLKASLVYRVRLSQKPIESIGS